MHVRERQGHTLICHAEGGAVIFVFHGSPEPEFAGLARCERERGVPIAAGLARFDDVEGFGGEIPAQPGEYGL